MESFYCQSQWKTGYVLGDEGSGAWFGKQLITSFLYGKMPVDLAGKFEEKYRISKDVVIKNVYQKERPNTYLANFAEFMDANRLHPFIDSLLHKGMDEFVKTNILTYPKYWEYECHFTHTLGNSSSKNWASSIPTTRVSALSSKMAEELDTGVEEILSDHGLPAVHHTGCLQKA
ncbi:hypothetical protein FQR65_LT18571 [Abscondita terminalis]|nr:hypothetical protein FQR65_LT18571 [Abscondita terminalis]